jgi:DNA-binding transcriptional ArsR family regulator
MPYFLARNRELCSLPCQQLLTIKDSLIYSSQQLSQCLNICLSFFSMSRSAASADVFQAIADPTRRALLASLRQGEQPVKQLAEPFDMSLPAISQHLSVLCGAGLVTQCKRGRQRFYRLQPEPLQQVSVWIADYEPFWQHKLDALSDYLSDYLEDQPCNTPSR